MIHVQQMEFSGKVWSREKEGGVYNETETFGQSTFLFKNDFSLGEYVMNMFFIGIINRTNNCTCLDSFVNAVQKTKANAGLQFQPYEISHTIFSPI